MKPARFRSSAAAALVAIAALAVALMAGCSTSTIMTTCEAGATEPCMCNGVASGSRACGADGAGACRCPDASQNANDATDTAVDVIEPLDVSADSSDVSAAADIVEACVPMCGTRVCGDNGCGGTCGACSAGLICSGAGLCNPDPAVHWILEAVDAIVNDHNADGAAWDPFGGLPDPLVCLSIGIDRQCSAERTDTVAPVWNFRYPTAATATMLRSGVRIEVIDHDPTSADDVIGDVRVMATDADFVAPVWTVMVGRSNVRLRLTIAP